jgi:hypothetical protein
VLPRVPPPHFAWEIHSMDPHPNSDGIYAAHETESDQDTVERVDVKLRVEDLELLEVLQHQIPHRSSFCF